MTTYLFSSMMDEMSSADSDELSTLSGSPPSPLSGQDRSPGEEASPSELNFGIRKALGNSLGAKEADEAVRKDSIGSDGFVGDTVGRRDVRSLSEGESGEALAVAAAASEAAKISAVDWSGPQRKNVWDLDLRTL